MDFAAVTRRYYAAWHDCDPAWIGQPGPHWRATALRDQAVPFYPERYAVCLLHDGAGYVLSHAPGLTDTLSPLRQRWGETVPPLAQMETALAQVLGARPQRCVKFAFRQLQPVADPTVRPLGPRDEADFLAFFKDCHPQVTDTVWVPAYFAQIAQSGCGFGRWEDGRLVCANDLPGMPYLADQVQEIGINTHPAFRRRGFAIQVCRAAARAMVGRGKCPCWSCAADNEASAALARRVGFAPLGDWLLFPAR